MKPPEGPTHLARTAASTERGGRVDQRALAPRQRAAARGVRLGRAPANHPGAQHGRGRRRQPRQHARRHAAARARDAPAPHEALAANCREHKLTANKTQTNYKT